MKKLFLFLLLSTPVFASSISVLGGTAVWGNITGTLSDQTDLQSALNAKAGLASPTFTGTITTPNAIFSSLTATTVPYLNGSKQLTSSAVTPTELGYVSGVTSAIQTQLAAKAALASPTFTGTVTTPALNVSGQNVSTVPYLDSSKNLVSSAVTPTELGYVSGVSSAIQTQLGTKLPTTGVGLVEEIAGFLEVPTDKTYTLDQAAAYAYTINTLKIQSASGTATVAVKINGTNVTGISAVSVSSSLATATASAANSVAIGDKVTITFSSSSSPADVGFTLKVTR
jgi:hypothetical protein